VKSRSLLWSFCFCLLLIPSIAKADSVSVCGTTTASSLSGTTCTIGDKTFTFNTFIASSSTVLASVVFTPDATNPLSPSFTLSVPNGLTITATPTFFPPTVSADLNYTVATTNGAATMVGTDLSLNNASVSVTNNQFGGEALVDASNIDFAVTYLNAPNQDPQPEVCVEASSPFQPSCFQLASAPPGPQTVSTIRTFATGPLSSMTGDAAFEFFANTGSFTGNTSSATFTSATYSFDQTANVPEPGTPLLLGTGLAALFGFGLWKKGSLANFAS
jgi:hypothetical protein